MKNRYVVGFAFNQEKTEVLLIQKTKPQWQVGLLNGIGGKIETTDMNSTHSMMREFLEECGLKTTDTDWKKFALLRSDFFEMEVFAGFFSQNFLEQYQTTTEEQVYLKKLQELFNNQFSLCVDNLKWLIPICLDSEFNHLLVETIYS